MCCFNGVGSDISVPLRKGLPIWFRKGPPIGRYGFLTIISIKLRNPGLQTWLCPSSEATGISGKRRHGEIYRRWCSETIWYQLVRRSVIKIIISKTVETWQDYPATLYLGDGSRTESVQKATKSYCCFSFSLKDRHTSLFTEVSSTSTPHGCYLPGHRHITKATDLQVPDAMPNQRLAVCIFIILPPSVMKFYQANTAPALTMITITNTTPFIHLLCSWWPAWALCRLSVCLWKPTDAIWLSIWWRQDYHIITIWWHLSSFSTFFLCLFCANRYERS